MSSLRKAETSRGLNQPRELLVVLFLALATVAVYWQVRGHEFVNWDDDRYVFANQHVQAGLTVESIKWAFTTGHASNWHPLTWLSHMLDCQLYGVNSGAHHMTSVLFHVANTALLFFILRRMTAAPWRSGFVAALFALHPLHVESVVWIAERKDVLSTLLWLLTMWAYIRYAEKPGMARYVPVVVLFALGLMAKPMLVTLPFVLLLLDYWPLRRLSHAGIATDNTVSRCLRLVYEKIPLFVLSAASSIVTYLVQRQGGSLVPAKKAPLLVRLANALLAYVKYIGKMLWPRDLAVLYPHSADASRLWQVATAGLLLACVGVLVFRLRRRYPYLAVGWLWYLGTLVPVIGFVQVGSQALADRYTYVPLIGLFIMIAWGVPELVGRRRHRRVGLAVSALAPIVALMVCTWFQVGLWSNSEVLFRHAVNVSWTNPVMHNNLGYTLLRQDRLDEAIVHFSEAIRMDPSFPTPYNNLGNALSRQGKLDEAIAHFSEALTIQPDYVSARTNLGIALAKQRQLDDAKAHFSKALAADPDNVDAHYNMGMVMIEQGSSEAAATHFSEALRVKPAFAEAHYYLGVVMLMQGKLAEAASEFEEVLRLRPDHDEARAYLNRVWQAEQ